MSFKPAVLVYDLNNTLVDDIAATIGATGLYTTINTYNEANALDAVRQYNRCFGLLTNKLTCIITGWNSYKTRRDQILFRLRDAEKRSPFREPTPFIIVTEDHMQDLRKIALDPADGNVAAYLDADNFKDVIADMLHKIVYENKAGELNAAAYQEALQQKE
jgi:hypothetical protein